MIFDLNVKMLAMYRYMLHNLASENELSSISFWIGVNMGNKKYMSGIPCVYTQMINGNYCE